MRVLVVGAGAVGSLLAATLASVGHDVVLGRRGGTRSTRELAVIDRSGTRRAGRVRDVPLGNVDEQPDLLLFAVKMPDLASAASACSAWHSAPALTVQNGIGAEECVTQARPAAPLLAASLTASVELAADGTVVRHTRGGIGLARFSGSAPHVMDALLHDFARGGLRARAYGDARAMKWSKLVLNLMANATSATLDVDPAAVYGDPTLFAIERAQLAEAFAVMRALGTRPVPLPGADVRLLALGSRLPSALVRPVLTRAVGSGRGSKMPSLRRHVREGDGPSEVRWLNGAVADHGAGVGVATPVNARLARLVDEVIDDPDRRAWFKLRPDRLVQEVLGRPPA